MATVERLYSDDVWLLNTEATNNSAVYLRAASSPFNIVTSLEFVTGAAYSGVFVASANVTGFRTFKALVVDTFGSLYTVTGQLQADINGMVVSSPVFTLVDAGVPAFSLAAFVVAPNVTWYYSTAPDVITPLTEAIGFTVVQGGVITFTTDHTVSTSRHASVRIIDGAIPGYPTIPNNERSVAADASSDIVSAITATSDPLIHAIIGAQLGDLELDIGKSVPWTSFFASNTYITDINIGTQRYWVIDWDKTFRTAKYTSLTVDYFTQPAEWRKQQFLAADAAWKYNANDWVLFIDGHEALSCDTRSAPDDVTVSPFAAFIHREVERATALGNEWASIPWFAFVRNDNITPESWEIEDPAAVAARLAAAGMSDIPVASVNTAVVYVGVPYYRQPTPGGLVRLVKVSLLRDITFDWSRLDVLSTPSTNVKIQVVSYGYAHWINPETQDDDGFEMRRQMSRVRPLPGLPMVGSDTAGLQGPYTYANNGVLTQQPGVGAAAAILTPMYYSVFRDNPRDGIWYQLGDLASPQVHLLPGTAVAVGTAFNKP